MESHIPVSIDKAKCVLIIGATSGIGRALALAISELPGRPTVVAAGRRKDRLKELKDRNLETLEIDVAADLETLQKTVDSVVAKYPSVRNRSYSSSLCVC
jgi:short-subunit dehydrogenase involved in D-alanine esterification of teichoic acids